MLNVNKLDTETYVCNYCGKTYNIRDAIIDKGNIFLCSMKCVLDYDKEVTCGS